MPERVKIKFQDDSIPIDPPAKRQKLESIRQLQVKPQPKVHNSNQAHGHVQAQNKRATNKSHQSNQAQGQVQPQNNRALGKLRERSQALLKFREKLPIWSQTAHVQRGLHERDVLLLVGETGSGKSTQVAQFLVDEDWASKHRNCPIPGTKEEVSVGGCIAITEPRRVAAVSLAQRVAEEIGTPVGSSSPASTVGYHVRFDRSVSTNTRIKFLTEGMLLQEVLRDPWLRQYSAVIVDEVHERSLNVDLILGFLRNIVCGEKSGRGGISLKVVVMSATADLEGLTRFFDEGFRQARNGDHAYELSTTTSDSRNTPANAAYTNSHAPLDLSVCRIKGRQYPVRILYSPSPVEDIIDASFRLVFKINYGEPLPGDILVFLTGREAVESLQKLINDWSPGLKKDVPKLLPLPLFASLPQTAQQRVFLPGPHRTRKVIIATNIAETSVTVPGVRHVIDCGKSKIKQYRAQIGLESLLCKEISQDAATQRTGRAGREGAGTCHRLYTEETHANFDKSTTPEILRCDLAQALLTMKAMGVGKPWQFPLLSPPPREAIRKGLEQLLQLGTLDEDGAITQLGRKVAMLPLSPLLGKIFMSAQEPQYDCLPEVIDIISCLSVETIFLQPSSEEAREKAVEARAALVRREGDHLTLLSAMQAYTMERTDRKAWCEDHLISHRAMKSAWNIRKQLRAQAAKGNAGSLDVTIEASPAVGSEERAAVILRCLLSGLVMKSALLCADGKYRTCEGKHEISIHPSSVLFGRKTEAILYGEHVYTSQSWARNVSAVQSQWIEEALDSC